MKRSVLFLLVGSLLCIQIILGFLLVQRPTQPKIDAVAVNALHKTIEDHYPDKEEMADVTSVYPYAVLNDKEEVVYASDAHIATTIAEAIVQEAVMLDLKQGNRQVGKIIIDTTTPNADEQAKTLWLWLLVGVSIMEVGILIAYWLYIRQTVVKPFTQLQRFAARVAGGDLDFPLTMDRQNIFGAFSESFDLMREELKSAKQKEQEANQSKKELVAKLSHDIKTPVASILAVSELMSIQVTSEKEKEQIQIIQDKANQIDTLISNLFHASLEELQELQVYPKEQESIDIQGLLMNADYEKKANPFTIPPCILLYDKLRLQQVLDNIFANAYKYGEGDMEVSSWFEDMYLVICIKNQGSGVHADEVPLLFHKFYRGKNAQGKSGTGLGLYISEYLMTMMKGKLTAQNVPDGFAVQIYLALASDEDL